MQNKYFKFLLIALVVAIIVPQITLAAWWNPVSWGLWGKIWSTFHKTVPSITIVSPQAGDVLKNNGASCTDKQCGPLAGGLAIILWNEQNGNYPVNISLLNQAGETIKTIAQNTLNTFKSNLSGVNHYTGEFVWPNDSSLEDGSYKIRITLVYPGKNSISADSGYFTITSSSSDQTVVPKTESWKTYKEYRGVVGYEIKYPETFIVGNGHCQEPSLGGYNHSISGDELKGETAIDISGEYTFKSDVQISICIFDINYKQISETKKSNFAKTMLDGHNALVRKNTTIGGESTFYYIDNGDTSLFINVFLPYPNPGEINRDELDSKWLIVNNILSTFKFIQDKMYDWKTYTSAQHGYYVKYPSDWSYSTSNGLTLYCDYPKKNYEACAGLLDSSIGDLNPGLTISISEESLEDFKKKLVVREQKDYILDGISGSKIIGAFIDGIGVDYTIIFITKNNINYLITMPPNPPAIDNQILSTFKFTK